MQMETENCDENNKESDYQPLDRSNLVSLDQNRITIENAYYHDNTNTNYMEMGDDYVDKGSCDDEDSFLSQNCINNIDTLNWNEQFSPPKHDLTIIHKQLSYSTGPCNKNVILDNTTTNEYESVSSRCFSIDKTSKISTFLMDKLNSKIIVECNNSDHTNVNQRNNTINTLIDKNELKMSTPILPSFSPKENIFINLNGRIIYSICEKNLTNYYVLPPKDQWKCAFNLPYGFEAAINLKGYVYFLDYISSTTTNTIILDQMMISSSSSSIKLSNSFSNMTVRIDANTVSSIDIDWRNFLDNECRIIRPITPSYGNNDMIRKYFKFGDRIVKINGIQMDTINSIEKAFNSDTNILEIEINRILNTQNIDTQSSNSASSMNYKSAFLSDARKASNKINKVSVHFSEKPVILEYQRALEIKQTELNTIETKYDNVIRIKLETGMIKTVKVSLNHSVFDVIQFVLGKLHYNHIDVFCLALVDSAKNSFHYFSRYQKISKVLNYKKSDATLECRLLIPHPPDDIKDWLNPEWILCFDYLYFQYRNELLSGNVVKNDIINDKTLLHLIGFVVATDKMVECLNKLEIYVDKSNPAKTVEETSLLNIGDLVIPSTFLADIDCRIHFLCKSIKSFNIRDHVLNIFSDLLPQQFFQLIFADIKQLNEQHFTMSESNFNTFKQITQNAQLAFLQLSIQFNLVGLQRFRVHVTQCPGVNIQESSPTGLPFHFYIDFQSGYGITKDTSNFNMLVGNFDNVIGLTASYNVDGRRVISIHSKHESPLIFITYDKECDNILVLMRSICSMRVTAKNSNQCYELPIVDLIDPACRVSSCDLPTFYDYPHLIVPAQWNHNASIEKFFIDYTNMIISSTQHTESCSSQSSLNSDYNNTEANMATKIDHNIDDKRTFNDISLEKRNSVLPYLLMLRCGYSMDCDDIVANIYDNNSSDNFNSNVASDIEDSESFLSKFWSNKVVHADEIDLKRKNSQFCNTTQQIDSCSMPIISSYDSPKIFKSMSNDTARGCLSVDSEGGDELIEHKQSNENASEFSVPHHTYKEDSAHYFNNSIKCSHVHNDVDSDIIKDSNDSSKVPLRPSVVRKLLKTLKNIRKNRNISFKRKL